MENIIFVDMFGGNMFGWMLVAALIISSIFLFFGKGSWLIAGFNTLKQEEKQKINVKRMCRECSVILFVCAVILTVQLLQLFDLPYGLLYLGIVVIYIIYKCNKKSETEK